VLGRSRLKRLQWCSPAKLVLAHLRRCASSACCSQKLPSECCRLFCAALHSVEGSYN
jgi:hypothetical protein